MELYHAKYGEYPDHVDILSTSEDDDRRLNCWQCASGYFYDPGHLTALGNKGFLNPRPNDPLRADGSQFPSGAIWVFDSNGDPQITVQGVAGYWYMVSRDKQNYKVVLKRPTTETGIVNFPDSLVDNYFLPAFNVFGVGISVYSSEISKTWAFYTLGCSNYGGPYMSSC